MAEETRVWKRLTDSSNPTGRASASTVAPSSSSSWTAVSRMASTSASTGHPGASNHAPILVPGRAGGELEAPRGCAVGVGPGQDTEQQLEVGDAAGQRPDHIDVRFGQPSTDVVEIAARGHDAEARLVSADPGEVGRHADRAPDVGAELERGEAARHRDRRSPRGTTGRPGRVPRVAGDTEQFVVRLAVPRPLGHVGLPEDDRAGSSDPCHCRRSSVGTWSRSSVAPPVDRIPAVSSASFTVMGSP